MRKLTENEQRAIIAQRLSDSFASDSELKADREQALNFYYGRPMGNELPGRSQVVSKDMMDTIEWMMPSLLRIFATKDAVQFDPVGPEDELLAKQETAYVTHVLWKENQGFMILYNWIKDALMQKVGYVQTRWEKQEKATYDEYTGLTDDQLALVLEDLQSQGNVDVVGHQQADDGSWSVKIRIKSTRGQAKIETLQPDEVIVSKDCRGDAKQSAFVARMRNDLTRSDLIELGYTRQVINALTDYVLPERDGENQARDSVNESVGDDDDSNTADWASVKVRLLECYTYLDVDGDGVAELRHYLVGGDSFLENEEFPDIPIDSWTPVPIPHRHVGLSIYDLMEDLQRIKTALQRGLLDNVYFTNNPRNVYNKDTIDVASLQINRPGGHVANKGPVAGSIMPMPVTPMAGNLLPVIDYMDAVKETRTGVGRMTSGVDADVLAQSTKGAYTDAKSAANQRIEAIARIFAETGLSSLYSSLHKLLSRHQDWQTRFKLRNDWVEVNPTEWRERANMTVSVGLGNSSREEIRANLMAMATAQEKAAQVPGLIQPDDVYSLFRRIQAELGFENEKFATDPKSEQYQKFVQSQQKGGDDPLVGAEKVKQQGALQGKMIDATIKREQMAQDRDLAITQMEVDTGIDLAKAGIGAQVAVARGQGNPGTERPPAS